MPKRLQTIPFAGLASDYAAGTRIEPHRHDTHQIVHSISGALRVTTEDNVWMVPPGRALWMPAGVQHAIDCVSAARMRTVYIAPALPGLPPQPSVWTVSALMREILVRFATWPRAADEVHLKAMLLAEIESVRGQPLNLQMPTDSRLRRLADTLLAEPANPTSLTDWAWQLGFSQRSLMRKFQAETGMNFRLWRRQARLLAALAHLTAGESVTQVAIGVGYASVSAFIKAFRESFGTTPRRFLTSGVGE